MSDAEPRHPIYAAIRRWSPDRGPHAFRSRDDLARSILALKGISTEEFDPDAAWDLHVAYTMTLDPSSRYRHATELALRNVFTAVREEAGIDQPEGDGPDMIELFYPGWIASGDRPEVHALFEADHPEPVFQNALDAAIHWRDEFLRSCVDVARRHREIGDSDAPELPPES